MHEKVLLKMLPFLKDSYGNPSALYDLGKQANLAIQAARKEVASLINSKDNKIIFTSGGSEANSTIIMGYCLRKAPKAGHIITTSIEHPAILKACEFLEKEHDYSITYLPINSDGIIELNQLENEIRNNTVMISIMMINNELGTIQPIRSVGEISKRNGIHFHCDAVQAVGKVGIDVEELKIDSLSLSAHKFGGPKGIGALYLFNKSDIMPLIHGGGQEEGLRSGTENVAGIVGLGEAAKLAKERYEFLKEHFVQLRKLFLSKLEEQLDGWELNVGGEFVYPSTLNIAFDDIRAEALATMLNFYNVSISIGSACSSSSPKQSHVLTALGLSNEKIRSSVRISFGYQTEESEVLYAAETLIHTVMQLRQLSIQKV